MGIPHFEIPEIPWDKVDEARSRLRGYWNHTDLGLARPVMRVDWTHADQDADDPPPATTAQRIADPEADVRAQLATVRTQVEALEAGAEIGCPTANTYHCCMTYERYFPSIVKTAGFMGFDADPRYNEFQRIEEALSRHRGVWTYECGPGDAGYVRRLKGRVPVYFHVRGDTREKAIASTKELLAAL